MKLNNPQTFEYQHANFNGQKVLVSVNDIPTDEATLSLDVIGINGKVGSAQLQMQDNGNVVIRVHLGPNNPIHVLILDDTGVLFEQ